MSKDSNSNGCLIIVFVIVLIIAVAELCERVDKLENKILQNERTDSIIQDS